MRSIIFTLMLILLPFMSTALAETKTVMISINKSVPLEEAEKMASELEYDVKSPNSCYMKAQITSYIPYPDCQKDLTCPYWSVVIMDLNWQCDESLKTWLNRVLTSPHYTIYSNGPIGPFPIVSGGN